MLRAKKHLKKNGHSKTVGRPKFLGANLLTLSEHSCLFGIPPLKAQKDNIC